MMADADKYYGAFARLHPPPHKVEEAVAEYKARQEAEREDGTAQSHEVGGGIKSSQRA